MKEMSIRDELRTYSKGDLTRIAVMATQKQAAAEAKYKRLVAGAATFCVVAFVVGVAIGAGAVLFFGLGG